MAESITRYGILVGVDRSDCAKTAVRWAAAEAAMRKVSLTVVHAMPQPPGRPVGPRVFDGATAGGFRPPSTGTRSAGPRRRDQDHRRRHRKRRSTAHWQSGAVFTGNSHIGRLSPVAEMIVVGRHGQNPLQPGLLGSVARGLIRYAPCPVAVIPETAVPLNRSTAPVVVGIDGSPASELATAIAFDEASFHGVDLVALHAWSDADVAGFPGLNRTLILSAASETLAERLRGGRNATPTSPSAPWWSWEGPHGICWSSPRQRNWWWAATAAVGSRAYCSAR